MSISNSLVTELRKTTVHYTPEAVVKAIFIATRLCQHNGIADQMVITVAVNEAVRAYFHEGPIDTETMTQAGALEAVLELVGPAIIEQLLSPTDTVITISELGTQDKSRVAQEPSCPHQILRCFQKLCSYSYKKRNY